MIRPNALPAILLASSLLLMTGCPSPDLGVAPFVCNNGLPRCPTGYRCLKAGSQEICVKEGTAIPKLDGGKKDLSLSDADFGARDLTRDMNLTDAEGGVAADQSVAPPSIIITEFMADPSASTDETGEWIELHNPGSNNVNINGWTLKDTQTDLHKLKNTGPLFVPAKGYLVIGRTTNTSQNGGTPVAYAYDKEFNLSNTVDEILLYNEKMQVVDSFAYSTNLGFSITTGSSLSLKSPGLDKTKGSNWCVETSTWMGSHGDRGTPQGNPNCK